MPRHGFALAFAACALAFPPAAQAAVQVTIDKSIQQMTVEVDGRPLYHWPVSTGKGAQYDTPNGKFKAFRMERDHFSKEWDDAPMPHSIFFTPKGHAIHGSFDVKRLGTPASHGCVRLAPANAEKLYALVEKERSEEHTSELQSPCNLVCRLLLEKKKKNKNHTDRHTYLK